MADIIHWPLMKVTSRSIVFEISFDK